MITSFGHVLTSGGEAPASVFVGRHRLIIDEATDGRIRGLASAIDAKPRNLAMPKSAKKTGALKAGAWFVYILRCADRSLYTGVTGEGRLSLDDPIPLVKLCMGETASGTHSPPCVLTARPIFERGGIDLS